MVQGFGLSLLPEARRLRATAESANTAPSKDRFWWDRLGTQVFFYIFFRLQCLKLCKHRCFFALVIRPGARRWFGLFGRRAARKTHALV